MTFGGCGFLDWAGFVLMMITVRRLLWVLSDLGCGFVAVQEEAKLVSADGSEL